MLDFKCRERWRTHDWGWYYDANWNPYVQWLVHSQHVIEETYDSLIIDLLISFCFHDISVLFILLSFIFTKRDTAMFKCRFTINKKRFIFRSMQVWHNRVILSRHVVSARSSNEILDLYEYFPCCCKRRKHGLGLVLYYLIRLDL